MIETTMSFRRGAHEAEEIKMMRKIMSHLLPAPRGCYLLIVFNPKFETNDRYASLDSNA